MRGQKKNARGLNAGVQEAVERGSAIRYGDEKSVSHPREKANIGDAPNGQSMSAAPLELVECTELDVIVAAALRARRVRAAEYDAEIERAQSYARTFVDELGRALGPSRSPVLLSAMIGRVVDETAAWLNRSNTWRSKSAVRSRQIRSNASGSQTKSESNNPQRSSSSEVRHAS